MKRQRSDRCGGTSGRRFMAGAGWVASILLSGSLCAVAQAQTPIPYKVIGPDGRVTYTDRPAPGEGRITPVVSGTAVALPASAPLPLELREPVARYPVTLYLADTDCQPCLTARQLLRQRGVPYGERQVTSAEDGSALERLSGGRELPTLAIGSQILRGLAPEVWMSYLDAAGYPRQSRLPVGYQYLPATPLVAQAPPPIPRDAANGPRAAPTLPNLPNASGIRF